ncbi:hypothetical protein [Amphiplicatus metriothermophilus]|uniref:N-acetyltransferase domain-containing protein n=1 Tax=Amphiplicatus metriothermophilus TaxID=1519374 RepID=A0A239PJG2_9PROT|nr:hypothetical protein [Amphiplicatus metriothermophilus]MBB5517734.1 hypothetical protein [Amphiplicatus metriothermophilus]SNT67932.1 hypothetical protein SAMN06297382_0425 [Amphiplicatus metriothermophilus]
MNEIASNRTGSAAAIAGVEIRPAETAAERRAFIRAGTVPYRDDPNYVVPLEFELAQRLDPKSNPGLRGADHRLWIAYKGGAPAGRIAALVNPLHLETHKDGAAHFGFLEAVDDADVFAALFAAAEDWARERGMKKLAGPFSFSVNEECGLLVDGFDSPPYFMMPHGRPYYKDRVEALNYAKAIDMYALSWINQRQFIPEKRRKFVERALASDRVSIRNIDMKNFVRDIRTIVDIYNDAWRDNWGFIPFTEEQARRMASELRPLIEKHNVVICYYDGEPAAFGLVLPNVNELIRDFDGKLLPFNWLRLIWRLKVKRVTQGRMPLMGVRRKLHGKPVGAAFAYKIIDMVNAANMDLGMTSSELSWILETNKAMLSMLLDMGGRVYKTYRIYEKAL